MKKEASTEVRRIKKELHSIEANHGEMEFSKLIVEGELKACKRKCEELREQVLKFVSIEASHGEMALSKLIVEDELKAYKRECEELKEQVLRLKEDKGVISDREVRGEERYKKLVEDVKKQEDVQKVRLVELQGRIKELERGKRASEALVELYKSRFEELGLRVLRLEEDAKVLMIEQPLVSKRVEEGVRVVNARSNEVMDTSGDTRGPHSGQIAHVNEAKEKDDPSDSEMKFGRHTCEDIVEISDSDDEPMGDNSLASGLKRKRVSPSVNGSQCVGGKMKQHRDLNPKQKDLRGDRCSTVHTSSRGNRVETFVIPSRPNSEVLRSCEEKVRSEQKSERYTGGFFVSKLEDS